MAAELRINNWLLTSDDLFRKVFTDSLKNNIMHTVEISRYGRSRDIIYFNW